MRIDYTQPAAERVREDEHSSAGQQTQQLSWPPRAAAVRRTHRRNTTMGLVLIMAGGLLLLGRLLSSNGGVLGLIPDSPFLPSKDDLQGGMVLLTIASCFLFFAFSRRIYLLLIPGCILTGLSIGVTFATLTNGVSVLWGLALGFMAIYLLGGAFNIRSSWSFWPVVPAVPLFAVGMLAALWNMPALFSGGLIGLPLLLFGLGLYLWDGSREHAEE